jgi:simple sugar transport system ATP-binding protein
VSGNGQDPLAQVAGGFLAPSSGQALLFGEPALRANAERDVEGRVGRIPADRQAAGVVPDMEIWENAILETANRRRFAPFGMLRRRAAMAFAEGLIRRFDIRCKGPGAPIGALSGGNMQKLILGRVFSLGPRFIIANQPTRGLDVGAAAFVQERLLEAREGGAAILLISEDLDELLSLADRIAVIYRGRLTAAKPAGALTTREIGLLMAGQWREAGHAH